MASVLQKSKQIGILKCMGARRRQILTVFIFAGLGVPIVDSALGVLLEMPVVYLLSLQTAVDDADKAGA